MALVLAYRGNKMSENQQLSVREMNVMNTFNATALKEQMDNLLDGDKKKIEAFRTKLMRISMNYGVDKCTPESVIKSGVQALTLGLELELGQGYIVNYGGAATLDVGYKGWQIIAKRAGYSVLADAVYACDTFIQSGFGFNKEMLFEPNTKERKSANDAWAKENLVGVIVSIREDINGNETLSFVPADMIHKIVGTAPSINSNSSPHKKWAEQMFCAKAIKQVLSKFAIDISKSNQLADAINYVNNTEAMAQQPVSTGKEPYSNESFNENKPKWIELIKIGKVRPAAIVAMLSGKHAISEDQAKTIMDLEKYAPIEGEVTSA